MAEKFSSWSSWGDTGPIIGINASISESKSTATVIFEFLYRRRYNYGFAQSFSTTATAYVDDSYYGVVSFQPYNTSTYTLNTNATLISGSKTFNKRSYDYNVTLSFNVSRWGVDSWNKISPDADTDAGRATRNVSLTVTIPKINKVDTPTISTSYSVRTPSSNSFTISWNSVDNATSYDVTLSDSTGAYSESASVTSTSKTFTVSNLSNYRGSIFTAYVCAVGSGDYANSNTADKQIAKINTLPGYPSVTRQSTTLLTMQNSISFTVVAGSDSDERTTSLYYSLDGGATKDVFTSPLEIRHDTTGGGGVISGSNTISFYTYDGLEYSAATTKTFTAMFAPVIGPVNTIHTYVANMSGNITSLVSKTDITFSMDSGAVKNVVLYLRSASSTNSLETATEEIVSTDKYSYNDSTKTITITTSDIASLVTDGHYYQFAFTVSDGITSSTKTSWQTYARKPSAPILPIFNFIENDGLTTEAKSNYYKNKVTITFTNPTNDDACAIVTSIVIIASYGNTKEYACDISSGSKTLILDLSQVNGNATTTFKFKVTDAAGQTKTSDAAFATMIKSSTLAFGGSIVNVTNDNLKPNTNTADFDITHPFAQASGTNNIIYSYELQIDSKKVNIEEYSIINPSNPDQKTIQVAAEKINAYALELVENFNLVYGATIRVRATDGFGSIIELTKTIKINFTEPPVFSTSFFKIKHDYYTGTTSADALTGMEVPLVTVNNWETVKNKVMVNSGEGIIFVIPKATDLNNDIKQYNIYLSRNDFYDPNRVQGYDQVTYSPWLTISRETLEAGNKDNNGNYLYLFKASQYSKNEYFYFKLQAEDEMGNVSKDVWCENYIVGCRTMSPQFSIGNVKVEKNNDDNTQSYKITLTYNFRITDLGGSAKSSGWEVNYYNNYPNFERTISGYTPQANLVISISPDQSFNSKVFTSSPINFIPGNGQQLLGFSSTSVVFSSDNFTKNSQNWKDFVEFASGNEKIFMKFVLTVSYGLQSEEVLANVVSAPQIYTYFGAVPTVAHRVHKVGINTTSLDQDDVLVVENYQGTRYVRLKGTDASDASKTYEITFDLLTGSINGAVIDCGTW